MSHLCYLAAIQYFDKKPIRYPFEPTGVFDVEFHLVLLVLGHLNWILRKELDEFEALDIELSEILRKSFTVVRFYIFLNTLVSSSPLGPRRHCFNRHLNRLLNLVLHLTGVIPLELGVVSEGAFIPIYIINHNMHFLLRFTSWCLDRLIFIK